MYRAKAEPMPGNNPRVGDKSGLWRVAVYERGSGSIIQEKLLNYHAENLSYEEAFDLASNLNSTLNG